MTKTPVSIEIVDEPEGRVIVKKFREGTETRKLIDQKAHPVRKEHRRYQVSRVKRIDYTKKKRF